MGLIPDQDPDFLPIPDPGVKKAPDPGSGSATLLQILSIHVARCVYQLMEAEGLGEKRMRKRDKGQEVSPLKRKSALTAKVRVVLSGPSVH